jgi:hypothetical protein
MKSLFMNTKKLSMVVLNNFKPMIPEQFHAIWQKELTLTITLKTMWFWWRWIYSRLYTRHGTSQVILEGL